MTMPTFDINAAIQVLREGKDLTGKDGILTPLIKPLTESALVAELDNHLAATEGANRKNGKTTKTKAVHNSVSGNIHRVVERIP